MGVAVEAMFELSCEGRAVKLGVWHFSRPTSYPASSLFWGHYAFSYFYVSIREMIMYEVDVLSWSLGTPAALSLDPGEACLSSLAVQCAYCHQ